MHGVEERGRERGGLRREEDSAKIHTANIHTAKMHTAKIHTAKIHSSPPRFKRPEGALRPLHSAVNLAAVNLRAVCESVCESAGRLRRCVARCAPTLLLGYTLMLWCA